MSQLTGGSVSYERLVKTGDYENKKLSVTLTFTIDDGDDEGFLEERAMIRAVHLVEQGLKPKAIVAPTAREIAATAQFQKELSDKKSVKAPKAKPGPKTDAASIEAGMKEATAHALNENWPEGQVNGGKDRTVTEQLNRADPLKAAEPAARIIDTGKKVEPSSMVFPGDSRAAGNLELVQGSVPASGIDRTAPQEPNWSDQTTEAVTNEVLVKTVTAAVGRGIGQPAIRKLFEPLLPTGGEVKLSLIPMAARQAFLDAVAELKPVGK